MSPEAPEHFVDATTAADFLNIQPRYLLELARAGTLPGYPLGTGKRRVWRFRLTELAKAMEQLVSTRTTSNAYLSKRGEA
jgi:excisionase family DNA binding protein